MNSRGMSTLVTHVPKCVKMVTSVCFMSEWVSCLFAAITGRCGLLTQCGPTVGILLARKNHIGGTRFIQWPSGLGRNPQFTQILPNP
uniref:Uncharacterized protein n=1 Tax=Aegilops tauschii subsp. strangulata TaxID=200361 RepID=A0A453LP46_AEGTS